MQIPKTLLTRDGLPPNESNSVIGIYDSAERSATRTINADGSLSLSGPERQVSRLGHPLVNEVVIPLADKDRFNRTKPTGDGAFLNYVLFPELPKLFNLLYGIPVPTEPRNDLVTVFLTGIPGINKPANPAQVPCEMLRLNMATPPTRRPNPLGVIAGDVAGFPNGRRLIDDVVDIAERAAAGGYVLTPSFNRAPANRLGDGVDFNDRPFLPYFPYAALPHNPLDHEHHLLTPRHDGDRDRGDRGDRGDGGKGDRDDDGRHDDESAAVDGPEAWLVAGDPEPAQLDFSGANPAKNTDLEFTVPSASRASLKVYDLQGRLVRTLFDQDAAAGTFRASWDGRDDGGRVATKGIYFVRLATDHGVVKNLKVTLE
jgi:hypothetical protein